MTNKLSEESEKQLQKIFELITEYKELNPNASVNEAILVAVEMYKLTNKKQVNSDAELINALKEFIILEQNHINGSSNLGNF